MHTFELNIGSLTNPINGNGYIEVFPLVDDNGLIKKRDETFFRVVRKTLVKQLDFKEDEFEAIKTLILLGIINVELKIYLNGVEKWYGYLILDGDFDENKRTCSLVTSPIDEYSVMLNNLDVDVNIAEYNDNQVGMRRYSSVQRTTLPCYNGNRVEAKRVYDPDGNLSADPGTTNPDWSYTLDDGEGTCVTGGFHAYKFVGLKADFAAPGYTASVINTNTWLKAGSEAESFDTPINRVAPLFEILEALLFKADPTINISQSTYSSYINDGSNNIYNMFIMDKSDAKRNDSSNPATFEYITLEYLLKLYFTWFELSPYLDSSNNFFLIRQGNYTEVDYVANPQYDLITHNGIPLTNNQNKYKTDFSNKVNSEMLMFEDQLSTYFNKSIINYNLYFKAKIEWQYLDFNNNVEYLSNDPDEASDEGKVMISADSSNIIINRTNFDGSSMINGGMSAQLIIADHLYDNRPFNIGVHDGEDVTLERAADKSVIYTNVPIIDIDSIDFIYYVKSSLGLSIPVDLEIDFNGKFGKINMLLDVPFATTQLYEQVYLYSSSEGRICDEVGDPPEEVTVYSTVDEYGKGTLYANEEGTIIANLGYYKKTFKYYYFNGSILIIAGHCT